MLHAKLQDHRTSGLGVEDFKGFYMYHIYECGGHLCDVIRTIYIYFISPFQKRFHVKFGFDWSCGFRTEILENGGHIHVYSPGAGTDNPMGSYNFQ